MAFDFEKARAGFGLERGPAENVALEIQEFQVDGADPRQHVAIGKSLATGAEMAIALSPDKKAAERRHPRPEIADLIGSVERKGVVRFDVVVPSREPGRWTAQWVTILSRFPSESTVFVAPARVREPYTPEGGTPRVTLEIIRPNSQLVATSVDDVRQRLVDSLRPGLGVGAAYVRIIAPEGVLVKYVLPKFAGNEMLPPEDTVADLIRSIEKTLGEALPADDVVVDVVPIWLIGMGRAGKTDALAHNRTPDRFYRLDAGGTGFTPSIVALRRRRQNDSWFFLDARPTSGRPELLPIDKLALPQPDASDEAA